MKTVYMKNDEGFHICIQLNGTIVTLFSDNDDVYELVDYPTESIAREAASNLFQTCVHAGFGECSKPAVKKVPCAKRRRLDENGNFVRC